MAEREALARLSEPFQDNYGLMDSHTFQILLVTKEPIILIGIGEVRTICKLIPCQTLFPWGNTLER